MPESDTIANRAFVSSMPHPNSLLGVLNIASASHTAIILSQIEVDADLEIAYASTKLLDRTPLVRTQGEASK